MVERVPDMSDTKVQVGSCWETGEVTECANESTSSGGEGQEGCRPKPHVTVDSPRWLIIVEYLRYRDWMRREAHFRSMGSDRSANAYGVHPSRTGSAVDLTEQNYSSQPCWFSHRNTCILEHNSLSSG
jgi:hypothetical protein